MSEAVAQALLRIMSLSLQELAKAAAHEYDEDALVPAENDQWAPAFLRATRAAFVEAVARRGSWPTLQDVETMFGVISDWHRDRVTPHQAMLAYAELGLAFSHHATAARDGSVGELLRVLDDTAEQLAMTLAGRYAPVV